MGCGCGRSKKRTKIITNRPTITKTNQTTITKSVSISMLKIRYDKCLNCSFCLTTNDNKEAYKCLKLNKLVSQLIRDPQQSCPVNRFGAV